MYSLSSYSLILKWACISTGLNVRNSLTYRSLFSLIIFISLLFFLQFNLSEGAERDSEDLPNSPRHIPRCTWRYGHQWYPHSWRKHIYRKSFLSCQTVRNEKKEHDCVFVFYKHGAQIKVALFILVGQWIKMYSHLQFSSYVSSRMEKFFKDPMKFDPDRFHPDAAK